MDAWYLPADAYYVPAAEAEAYPPRMGDVFGPVAINGQDWAACELLHPTCELGKPKVDHVQIIRVRYLSELPDSRQQALVCTGWQERDGQLQVAVANTFFLPPVDHLGPREPLFANFRELVVIHKEALAKAGRVAALTAEARVTFIRRLIYFRFRYGFTYEEVLALEKARIGNDPTYQGPRPEWAPYLGEQEL